MPVGSATRNGVLRAGAVAEAGAAAAAARAEAEAARVRGGRAPTARGIVAEALRACVR